MLSDKIKKKILFKIPNAKIFIQTGDNIHFEIIVIDNIFIDYSIIDRHKIIYSVISYYILNKMLHAVSIKTYTILEWENLLKK